MTTTCCLVFRVAILVFDLVSLFVFCIILDFHCCCCLQITWSPACFWYWILFQTCSHHLYLMHPLPASVSISTPYAWHKGILLMRFAGMIQIHFDSSLTWLHFESKMKMAEQSPGHVLSMETSVERSKLPPCVFSVLISTSHILCAF